jgi:hypothetical protein
LNRRELAKELFDTRKDIYSDRPQVPMLQLYVVRLAVSPLFGR